MTKAVTSAADAELQSKITKLQTFTELLRRPDGASLDELMSATGWQKHSVRGAISGALKKKQRLQIASTVVDGRGRVYRIEPLSPDGAIHAASSVEGGEVQP